MSVTDRLASVVLALSIAGYPLIAPISLLFGLENRLVSIPFRVLVLLGSLWLIADALASSRRFRVSSTWVLWWGFWFLYLARLSVDSGLNPGELRLPVAEYWAYAVGMCLVPAVAVAIAGKEHLYECALNYLLVVAVAALLFNFAVLLPDGGVNGWKGVIAVRQQTETLNPISLGHVGATVFLIAAWQLTRRERFRSVTLVLLLVSAAIGLAGAVLGASRGPLVALILTFFLVMASSVRNIGSENWKRIVGLAIVGGLSGWVISRQIDTLGAIVRLQSALAGGDKSLGVRLELYVEAFEQFVESPMLGAGIEPTGFYPHNLVLESFVVFGVLSGLLFSILFIGAVGKGIRLIYGGSQIGWVGVITLQYAMAGLVSGALYTSTALWCLLGIFVGWSTIVESFREPLVVVRRGAKHGS